MIHKILTLKNVGAFKDVSFGGEYWNGVFEKTNAFYADNGSGKTTFTQILRSISSKPAANALLQIGGSKRLLKDISPFKSKLYGRAHYCI